MPQGEELTGKLEAGTYRLLMRSTGKGAPTVVLDSNLRGLSNDWEPIRARVARFTTVCTYDRSGVARPPLTSDQIVSDLHQLLDVSGAPPPYVLVGWAFGGYTVRLFARRFRDQVAGIVLIDALHEDFFRRYRAILPGRQSGTPDPLEDFRYQLAGGYRYLADMEASASQVRASDVSLGDLPLAVVTRGDPDWPLGISIDVVDRLENAWQEMQKDLVKLSTNSLHIVADRSGHLIHYDRPDVVVAAIRKVVDAARGRRRIEKV